MVSRRSVSRLTEGLYSLRTAGWGRGEPHGGGYAAMSANPMPWKVIGVHCFYLLNIYLLSALLLSSGKSSAPLATSEGTCAQFGLIILTRILIS